MTSIELMIIEMAIKIRLKNGEDLETILMSYPKLSLDEMENFRKKFGITETTVQQ